MLLALNCTEELLQVVLGQDGRVAASLETGNGGKVNAILAPAVAAMLSQAGIRPGELSAVACVRGPGSFTGVRLGLAFCHGLCLAAGVPLAGLDYLPLLAANALAGRENADGPPELHVLTYSRRAKVYHQAFAGDTPLGPPLDLPVDQALALVNARAAQVAGCARGIGNAGAPGAGAVRLLAVGSGLARNAEAFQALDPRFERLPHLNPTPEALLLAASAAPATGPPVDVLYLRGSDAEENFLEFTALRGLDAREATRRLKKAME